MDLHRFLGGLAVVFTGVHLAGLFFDSYVHFGFRELFIPFASEWQPNAVAWGVVALYLLLAVEVTSLLRRRVGERVWRATHYLGFAVFVLGTIHGLKAGTDVSNPLLWWPAAGLSAAIIGLCVARVSANGDPVPAGGVVRASNLNESLDIDVAPELSIPAPLSAAAAPVSAPVSATTPRLAAEVGPEPVVAPDEPRAIAPEISVLERTIEALLNLDAPPVVTPAATAPERLHDADTTPEPSVLAQRTAEPSMAKPVDQSVWSPPVVESHSVPTEPLAVRAPKVATIGPAADLRNRQPAASHRRREEFSDRPSGASGVSTVERTRAYEQSEPTSDTHDPGSARRAAGPPLPPAEVDPVTGEPDPQAYRKWLKEWLAYVESQI